MKRLEEEKISHRDFEAKAGLKPWSIKGILQPEKWTVPSVDKAKEIAEALGLDFFLGPQEKKETETVTVLDAQEYSVLPVTNAEASAGPGAHNGDDEIVGNLAFRQDWLSKIGVSSQTACLVKVRGDSMTPGLQPGDIALVDRNRSDVVTGRVYAFNDRDGQTRIKRIDRPDRASLILRSDNPEHPAEMRRGHDLDRMKIIGEVVWSGHSWL